MSHVSHIELGRGHAKERLQDCPPGLPLISPPPLLLEHPLGKEEEAPASDISPMRVGPKLSNPPLPSRISSRWGATVSYQSTFQKIIISARFKPTKPNSLPSCLLFSPFSLFSYSFMSLFLSSNSMWVKLPNDQFLAFIRSVTSNFDQFVV